MRALNIAATGMDAQQSRVEVISNNLANMSTTAYQPRRAEFTDLHYQQAARPGTITSADGTELPTGVQLGLGVRLASVTMDQEQGSLQQTGGTYDLALEGNGFFEVTLPDGRAGFTRDGALKRSGEGQIVTSDGLPLAPDIVIPADAADVSINADGEVYAYFRDQVQPQLLGQITLATFTNPQGLEALGGNLYVETPASGGPVIGAPGLEGRGSIRQGYLESSAVDAVREMTDLIEAQRGYELNSKVITAADQMLSATVQMR
ncbi:flagellar basal-body rod protein FlgG [Rubricella aquisinus]|uniref:Flagellar basal-body rod protein FlgG n=1 Tax=Rubricella aquisinus TaxID=2028108 RepID=A0A840WM90_9RHOB|nr:flagellar basal-body rod protein FlgG [Rubricella aquisinus]MBB5515233.1 flagellar basal-body rod protein FlgG [Rubricella aquisinus]